MHSLLSIIHCIYVTLAIPLLFSCKNEMILYLRKMNFLRSYDGKMPYHLQTGKYDYHIFNFS